jgi:hypothetical protein
VPGFWARKGHSGAAAAVFGAAALDEFDKESQLYKSWWENRIRHSQIRSWPGTMRTLEEAPGQVLVGAEAEHAISALALFQHLTAPASRPGLSRAAAEDAPAAP